MIDPVGIVVEEWLIEGQIREVNFGNCDYQSEEPLTPQIFIKPKNCQLLK